MSPDRPSEMSRDEPERYRDAASQVREGFKAQLAGVSAAWLDDFAGRARRARETLIVRCIASDYTLRVREIR
jgi:hypothetical protein